MKYYNFLKTGLLSISLIASGCLMTSCDDDINLGKVNEDNYTTSGENIGYILNDEGRRTLSSTEFREEGSMTLYFSSSKDAKEDIKATLEFDESVLTQYNEQNESKYKLYPKSLVTFANNGAVELKAGSNKSTGVVVDFKTDNTLKSDTTYVIPVRVQVKSGNIKLSDKESTFLIFVKDQSMIPDCNKSTGIKIISCMEVNDTNPLNNLCFTLKGSGKPLIDMVILFSANINYSEETGQVYVYNNPNVQHILDNRAKYLKPLQDRGMKVVLGILGNHDRSGVANLSESTAKLFAKELKNVCDAYKLDGIFYDDEYSAYQYPAPEGFVNPSYDAAARLCYETKQAMPDRLVCAYVYGRTSYFTNPIDGVKAGEFVDYGIHDYGGGYDLSYNYPGMPKSGMALYSQEFARGYYASTSSLNSLRNNGYGAHMIFAMDPNRWNANRQIQAMSSIATTLFDDELVYDGKPYKKDW